MAGWLAVFYALCVLAPAAAFAFGDGANAAHCLIDSNHHGVQAVQVQADQMHQHGDGTMHMHQQQAAVDHGTKDHGTKDLGTKNDHGTKKAADAQCCGLICLTAMPTTDMMVGVPSIVRAPLVLSRPDEIAGQSPSRLDRPPNSSAAVLS